MIYKRTKSKDNNKYGNVNDDVINPVHSNINNDAKDIEYDDTFG